MDDPLKFRNLVSQRQELLQLAIFYSCSTNGQNAVDISLNLRPSEGIAMGLLRLQAYCDDTQPEHERHRLPPSAT